MECPKCNYPNIVGLANCQDCGYDLRKETLLDSQITIKSQDTNSRKTKGQSKNKDGRNENERKSSSTTVKHSGNNNLRETISDDAYLNPKEDREYNLQPVSLGSKLTYKPLYFDKELEVSRAMVDRDDFSISTEKHAVISKTKGRWYIENTASNSAVFIKVKPGKRLRIELGDIILFGSNKFFEFQKTDEGKE